MQRPRSECDFEARTQNTHFERNLAGMCVHACAQAHAHVRKVKILGTLGTRGSNQGLTRDDICTHFTFKMGTDPP